MHVPRKSLGRTGPLGGHPSRKLLKATSEPRCSAFLPVSATSQINAVQMLVSLSRASQEVRLYTDSSEVLKEAAIRPGQGRSAVELMDGVAMPRNDSAMGHYEKELRQELAQKYPSLSAAQAARLEKEIQEAVMKHQKILQRNAAAHEQHHPPPPPQPKNDRTQERGMSRGF